jgi:endoglucanase
LAAYSSTLLTHAQQLFTFGDTYRGNYANSISNAAGFYKLVLLGISNVF